MKRVSNKLISFILFSVSLFQIPLALASDASTNSSAPAVGSPTRCQTISITMVNDSAGLLFLRDMQVTNGTLVKPAKVVYGTTQGGGSKVNEIAIDQSKETLDNLSGVLTYTNDQGAGCTVTFSCPIQRTGDNKNVCAASTFTVNATPINNKLVSATCSAQATQPNCLEYSNESSAQGQANFNFRYNK